MWQTEIGNYGWFFALLPLPPLKTQKIRILKNWKKLLEKSSFHTCLPKTTIIWGTVPEILGGTDKFWSFWAIFCPFTPLTIKNLKNQNFEKMRCHHFAHVYQISQSYDACFLRHGAQQTEFLFFRGQFFLPLYPNKNLKNQNFEKMKKATTTKKKHLEISSFYTCVPQTKTV